MRVLAKIILLGGVALGAMAAAQAQESPRDVVVVTGTRVENRSALDTAVAVDVVGGEALEKMGVTEVNQALAVSLPSFNFPRPALNDGTDTVRPATLRGLAPDQTLVLVNSKRRHQAALVNINGSIGRGSSAVDLNTVPSAAISAVEVLRDGASAQYGSDAIAGVINVRLREANSGGAVNVTYGQRVTTYEVPVQPPVAGLPISVGPTKSRDRNDGETTTISAWKGFDLNGSGFVTVAAEGKWQDHTERPGYDTRQQYPLVGGAFDPREATFDRWNAWTGEPQVEQYTVFVNAGYDYSDTGHLYGWASYQDRDALSAGFYRRAQDTRNVLAIYPDGFLPKINPTVTDASVAVGSTFLLGGWDMDASVVYGSNKMDYTIRNTLNASIGPSSKTVFDAGGFELSQVVANLSAVRQFDIGMFAPLNVAAGIEARKEKYEIFAGEPDSYRNGGVLLANGGAAASGAQVFPGFQPKDEVNEDRTAVGVYVDLETNLSENFLVSAALRAEDYSDFGDTVTGKLSARYDFTDSFALRASVQNGFRAPSLQQQYFSTTSTNFVNGVPFDITTFPVTNPVAVALGAKPLEAEESVNYAVGAVIRLGALDITIDAYRIDVDGRIVLSENLGTTTSAADNAVKAYLLSQGFQGAAGRFFLSGIDTETTGVDIVADYSFGETAAGKFDVTFGANFNSTDVTSVPGTPQLTALNPPPVLFGRDRVLTFEEGQPKDKYTLALDWSLGAFSATARAIRYGEVLVPSSNAAFDQTLSAKTLVDLEGRYSLNDMVTVSLGADNVFDEYPDASYLTSTVNLNSTGNTPYSTYSPFGFSGRYVYAKLNFSF